MNRSQFSQELDNLWLRLKLPGCPDVQTDNYGQLIIYTGIKENDVNEFREFDAELDTGDDD